VTTKSPPPPTGREKPKRRQIENRKTSRKGWPTADQRASLYQHAKQMILRCKTKFQIRQELSKLADLAPGRQLCEDYIHKVWDDVHAEWEKKTDIDYGRYIQRELQKLDAQEAELWEAWDKSKQDATTQSVETQNIGGEDAAESATDEPEQQGEGKEKRKRGRPRTAMKKSIQKRTGTGNGQYQQLILQIQERRAKLLGLDAPKKTESSGPDGGPIPITPVASMPPVIITINGEPWKATPSPEPASKA